MLRYSVDEITCERVRGWAYDDGSRGGGVEIAVAVDGREVGRVGTHAFRPDVVDALGDPRAAHSGFEVALPREALEASPVPHAEVSVHIGGREVARCPVPGTRDRHRRAMDGPAAPDVMGLLTAFRAEYATATWDDDTARSAVDDLAFLLTRRPRPARELHQYLATIAQL